MALPQTVGFKAEAVDEEGVWCACIVEEATFFLEIPYVTWQGFLEMAHSFTRFKN